MGNLSQLPLKIKPWSEAGNLCELDATHLHQALESATLFELKGKTDQWVFCSGLIHGNEPAGFEALKRLIRYLEKAPEQERSIMFFIGNVAAAKEGLRNLPGEVDWNRIWAAPENYGFAHELLRLIKKRNIFAAIDIHNNTGTNPYYGAISKLEPEFVQMASLFNRTVVYFRQPETALSVVLSKTLPAITLECGRPEDKLGAEKAATLITDILRINDLDRKFPPKVDLDIYETVGKMSIASEASIAFAEDPYSVRRKADICFVADLEKLNFRKLEPGFVLAKLQTEVGKGSISQHSTTPDLTNLPKFLSIDGNQLVVAEEFVPAMLTRKQEIIFQDCLGYIMRSIAIN